MSSERFKPPFSSCRLFRWRSGAVLLCAGLLTLAAACSPSPSAVRETPAPDARVGKALEEISAQYRAGRQAMNTGNIPLAQTRLDSAFDLLSRLDGEVLPRAYISERRLIRLEIESALDALNSASVSAAPVEAVKDTLYPEEQHAPTGFVVLAQLMASRSAAPLRDIPAVAPDRFDLPLEINAQTRLGLHTLQTSGASIFESWLNRTNRYAPMIRSILTREGLPGDLLYVAMVESGFYPRYLGPDDRAGLWGLRRTDSAAYGLIRSSDIDERYDPEKATRAVAQRFKSLYGQLTDWKLTLAAHHAGLPAVQEAIQKRGVTDVWQMDLPSETRTFVALVMAAAIISKDPAGYGFSLSSAFPLTYETVPVEQNIHLSQIAVGAGIDLEVLKTLNPELRGWRIPPGYTLKVPVGTQAAYRKWAGISAEEPEPLELTTYTVRRGDTLARVAERHGVRARDIIEENDLRTPVRLKPGQVLYIPTYLQSQTSEATPVSQEKPAPRPSAPSSGSTTYRVKRGDTLSAIGRKFGVSIADLMAWNNLRRAGAIMAGQTLIVRATSVPAEAPASEAKTPPATTGREDTVIYTVRRGDTLWDIARRFNVTVGSIQAANKLNRSRDIRPGDRLKILRPSPP